MAELSKAEGEPRIRIQSLTPELEESTEDCIREIIRAQRNDPAAEPKAQYRAGAIGKSCQRFPNEDFKVAVDEDANMVVGTIRLRHLKEGVGQLMRFGVRPTFEGKGIGSQLYNDIVNFAKANQYKQIYLTTEGNDAHKKALGMYERRGFKQMNLADVPKEDLKLFLSGDDNLEHIQEGKTVIYKLELEQ